MIHTETGDAKSKDDRPTESQCSEWTFLLSKLVLQSRFIWIQS